MNLATVLLSIPHCPLSLYPSPFPDLNLKRTSYCGDQRHILRDRGPSTTALLSLLGDGDKEIEIVDGEEK
jgi:hypothetical protein